MISPAPDAEGPDRTPRGRADLAEAPPPAQFADCSISTGEHNEGPATSMKVSVLVVTYNHENFIAQALNSVLAQKVEFDYEVLVSEDRSTDRTRDIVTEFHQRYPDRIRLILSEHNLNSNEVVGRGIRAAKGQYVALLDGDDYWTSEHKLQRQAQFLDSHPDCAMCFHNAVVVYEDGSREPRNWTPPQQKEFSTLEDIWMGNFIATCSTMFPCPTTFPLASRDTCPDTNRRSPARTTCVYPCVA